MDDNSQLVVWLGDTKVVDLWGERTNLNETDIRGEKPYGPDSLTNAYSSGKPVASILMAILEDKGLLKYDDLICKYWPEFAKNGKQHIKICDLMRHESGLSRFLAEVPVEYTQTAAIKENKIGEIIENQKLFYPYDQKRAYHHVTRDWIANEIFRRVEPKGRTMGEYFEQEI